MIDQYITIEEPSIGEYKEKGSKFIAYAFPVRSEDDVSQYLEQVKSEHFKARHHCYAYFIGLDRELFRFNDDGEPSGTAGRPIFGQIQSFDLIDILIIVVRYFGGTKLGASGLIHAYKKAAKCALDGARFVEKFLCDIFLMEFQYDQMGNIMNIIKSLDLNIIEKKFEKNCQLKIEIRASKVEETMVQLKSTLLNVSPEYIDEKTEVDFCKIIKIEDA
jgi:uncharacterized YigZ family protein